MIICTPSRAHSALGPFLLLLHCCCVCQYRPAPLGLCLSPAPLTGGPMMGPSQAGKTWPRIARLLLPQPSSLKGAHTHTHSKIHTQRHTHTHTHRYTHRDRFTQSQIHTQRQTHTHSQIHTQRQTHTLTDTHTETHTHTHRYTHRDTLTDTHTETHTYPSPVMNV